MKENNGQNEYTEIWRKDCEIGSPSIIVTTEGNIGIRLDGQLIVAPIEKWHQWATFVAGPPVGHAEPTLNNEHVEKRLRLKGGKDRWK
mgnify:CR=1 FL=1